MHRLCGRIVEKINAAWKTDLLERKQNHMQVNDDGSLTVSVSAWGVQTVIMIFGEGNGK